VKRKQAMHINTLCLW